MTKEELHILLQEGFKTGFIVNETVNETVDEIVNYSTKEYPE